MQCAAVPGRSRHNDLVIKGDGTLPNPGRYRGHGRYSQQRGG